MGVVEWIEAVTGESKGDLQVQEWLHDGQVLCKVVNTIVPGTVKKIHTGKMVFKQRENITFFQDFCRQQGVPEISMFTTDDLFDGKNMVSVMHCIFTFGGRVQVTFPDFEPKLGVAIHAAIACDKRNVGPATQTGGLATAMEKSSAFTGKREVAAGSSTTGAVISPDDAKAAGFVQGLDSSLAEAKQRMLDSPEHKQLEHEVVSWIQTLTQSTCEGTAAEWLKDGTKLCELANVVKPDCIPVGSIHSTGGHFKFRENITFFQKAARELGVPESSLFGTDDLYEEKDMHTFLLGIVAYGGNVQKHRPDLPALGPAVHHLMEEIDKKRDGLMATSQYQAMEGVMEKEVVKDQGIMKGAHSK